MSKHFFLCFFSLLSFSRINLSAQSLDSSLNVQFKNAAYIEFFGSPGVFFSLNYERLKYFGEHKHNQIGLRLGFAYAFDSNETVTHFTYIIIPTELNFMFGKRNHFIESGIGCNVYQNVMDHEREKYLNNFLGFSLRLGWRYNDPEGRILIRAAPLLLLSPGSDKISDPKSSSLQFGWTAGISIGYYFNFRKPKK